MPNFLTQHLALASFFWGACKSLLPLPSPSGFVLLGAEAARRSDGLWRGGRAILFGVVLPGAAGMTLGGLPYYLWARLAGREAVDRWGPRLGVSKRRIQSFEARAERRRGALIFGLFALPLSPLLLAAAAAAVLNIELEGYGALAFLGALVRCAILAGIGWAFRFHLGDPARYIRPWELVAGGVVAAALAAVIVKRRLRGAA